MSVFKELHDKSAFDSAWEYENFERKLKEQIKIGSIFEIPATDPVSLLAGHEEHWYKNNDTGEVYRYVPPEFPARGIWEKV
jgi:oxalate decarboxylase/phosphoglucose isomerase-like protein (cupin superfamily)